MDPAAQPQGQPTARGPSALSAPTEVRTPDTVRFLVTLFIPNLNHGVCPHSGGWAPRSLVGLRIQCVHRPRCPVDRAEQEGDSTGARGHSSCCPFRGLHPNSTRVTNESKPTGTEAQAPSGCRAVGTAMGTAVGTEPAARGSQRWQSSSKGPVCSAVWHPWACNCLWGRPCDEG